MKRKTTAVERPLEHKNPVRRKRPAWQVASGKMRQMRAKTRFILFAAAAGLSGCRWMAHAWERELRVEETVLNREVRSESEIVLGAAPPECVVLEEGLEIRVETRVLATIQGRVTTRREEVDHCSCNSAFGEREDGHGSFSRASNIIEFPITAVMWTGPVLLIPPFTPFWFLALTEFLVEAAFWIPFHAGGHEYSGNCPYIGGRRLIAEYSEDQSWTEERRRPAPFAKLTVRRSKSKEEAATLTCDGQGVIFMPYSEVMRWVGLSIDHTFLEPSGSAGDPSGRSWIPLETIVERASQGTCDWSSRRAERAPVLVATARRNGEWLDVEVGNTGVNDGARIWAELRPANAAPRQFRAVGRLSPGTTRTVSFRLSRGDPATIEFGEAGNAVPDPLVVTSGGEK